MRKIAFYAPMKAPDHPTPSGDRAIARLLLQALEQAGYRPHLVSRLRTLEMAGCATTQKAIVDLASDEITRIMREAGAPDLWFTYHCYYKAPDLLGPTISRALKIPYVIAEPSIAPKKRQGPWADFAARSEAAIGAADLLFWTTDRDRPALAAAGHKPRLLHLPAFVDPGPEPVIRDAGNPLCLLAVGMMRPGDKQESYRRLAAAMAFLQADWQLDIIGDGPMRRDVENLFSPFGNRVRLLGRIDDAQSIRRHYEQADLLVWPGVNEGVGLSVLEAQAAGLPVVGENHPANRNLNAEKSLLVPANDAPALARTIMQAGARRQALGQKARDHVLQHHSLNMAASRLGQALRRFHP